MGRGATKAAGNVWYEARMEAAKWNDKLLSRAGAAEALNMSEDAVKDAELGLNKCMPVDKAVLMADLYNFGCDFAVPVPDKELEELIRAWNGDERLPKRLVDVEAMTGRVEKLGGINLIWY